MKKVIFITSSIGIGGNEKVLLNILKTLDSNKFEIYLVVLDGKYEEASIPEYVRLVKTCADYEIVASGFRQGVLNAIKKRKVDLIPGFLREKIKDLKTGKKNYYINFWESHKEVINLLSGEYDVAVAFGLGIQVLYTAEKVFAQRKIAWVNNDCSKCLEKSEIKYLNSYYARYNKIVTVTPAADAGYKMTFNTLNIPTVVIKDLFDEAEIIKKAAEEPNTFKKEDGAIIVTVGRISPPKGYFLLLETAKYMKDRGEHFKWIIVGNGDATKYKRKAEELGIIDMVEFCGAKRNPYPYIKNCDIYVQTSLWEGNCLTLIEAMVLEKPIVTTNFPSALEKITNDVNGLICEMQPDSLANAVIRLLNSETLQKKFSNELSLHRINNKMEEKKIENLLLESISI